MHPEDIEQKINQHNFHKSYALNSYGAQVRGQGEIARRPKPGGQNREITKPRIQKTQKTLDKLMNL